jgi:methenyltetrahydromethanopterin cyclohydrolase
MPSNLNRLALRIADQMAANAGALGIVVQRLASGARVLDCGVKAPGGLEVGRLVAETCLAGLGQVDFTPLELGNWRWPSLTVHTDQPALACLGAQYAGWAVQYGDYYAMGSGPARALVRAEAALYDALGISESTENAVLCLETRVLPGAEVAAYIAEQAGVPTEALTLLVAPTASAAGGVQVAARVVETALHKLYALGFDVRQVLSGFGSCPLPPVAQDDAHAIGRTNDAVLYGGRVRLTVRADDAALEALVPRLPASASADYGEPFYHTLERANFDFYSIDPLLFSPAEIEVTNAASGRTFRAGAVNVDVLRRSFEKA